MLASHGVRTAAVLLLLLLGRGNVRVRPLVRGRKGGIMAIDLAQYATWAVLDSKEVSAAMGLCRRAAEGKLYS